MLIFRCFNNTADHNFELAYLRGLQLQACFHNVQEKKHHMSSSLLRCRPSTLEMSFLDLPGEDSFLKIVLVPTICEFLMIFLNEQSFLKIKICEFLMFLIIQIATNREERSRKPQSAIGETGVASIKFAKILKSVKSFPKNSDLINLYKMHPKEIGTSKTAQNSIHKTLDFTQVAKLLIPHSEEAVIKICQEFSKIIKNCQKIV